MENTWYNKYCNKKTFLDNKNIDQYLNLFKQSEKFISKINKLEDTFNDDIKKLEEDGGDIKFKEFKNGVVKVELQGSCSGCPSSTMTLKQGVQNLLKHYVKEVNSVEAV